MRSVGASALLTSKIHKRDNAEGSHHVSHRLARPDPVPAASAAAAALFHFANVPMLWLSSSEDRLSAGLQEGQDFEAKLAALDEHWQGGRGKTPIGPNYLTECSPGETYWVTDYKGISTRRKHAKLAKFAAGTVDCPGSIIKRNRILVRIIRGHSLKRMTRSLCNSIMLLCLAEPLAIWEKSC